MGWGMSGAGEAGSWATQSGEGDTIWSLPLVPVLGGPNLTA